MDNASASSSETPKSTKKILISVMFIIFAINSLILDFFLLSPKNQSSQTSSPKNTVAQNYCPQGCIDQINLSLKGQNASVSSSVGPTVTVVQKSFSLTPTRTTTPTSSPTPILKNVPKEFFVPLGAGTGNSADWAVVDGIGAKINPADYGDVKQIALEVAVFIPTGNQTIWIRLYNANTYQSVAGSEMTLSGGTATILTSSPITLSSGENLYQIQMKTQLQSTTNINMARLRIKTN